MQASPHEMIDNSGAMRVPGTGLVVTRGCVVDATGYGADSSLSGVVGGTLQHAVSAAVCESTSPPPRNRLGIIYEGAKSPSVSFAPNVPSLIGHPSGLMVTAGTSVCAIVEQMAFAHRMGRQHTGARRERVCAPAPPVAAAQHPPTAGGPALAGAAPCPPAAGAPAHPAVAPSRRTGAAVHPRPAAGDSRETLCTSFRE